MFKRIIIRMFFLLAGFIPLYGDIFFLYAHETFDGKNVSLDESVREGIMEKVFDAGHIIFDDISEKKLEIPVLLKQAYKYGADYLIVLDVRSLKIESMAEQEKITSRSEYSLYDARRDLLIGKGNYETENADNSNLLSRSRFWYNLGIFVAGEIEQLYQKYRS